MFKISIHKFLRILTTLLLVLAFALGVSGVKPARAVTRGTVVAWGNNEFGQSTVPVGLGDVTAIAVGDYHSLALKSDGTVVAWGDNTYGQSTVPAGLSDVTAIAAGGTHSLALKSDGTVVAWNWDGSLQTVPAGLSNVTAIAAGGYHSLAIVSLPSDTTAPNITINTPGDGATYTLGQAVNAEYGIL